jgi:hypothetical protein
MFIRRIFRALVASIFHSVATVRASTFDPVSENNRVRRRTTIT